MGVIVKNRQKSDDTNRDYRLQGGLERLPR